MHGVKRSQAATSGADRAARKEREATKLAGYLEAERAFFAVKEQQRLDQQVLEATTVLLTLNPELYTVWNYRRRVIVALAEAQPSESSSQSQDQPAPDFFASARTQAAGTSSQAPSSAKLAAKASLLEDDLELTSHALKVHPKVYWIWNHRKWCLIQMPDGDTDADDGSASGSSAQKGFSVKQRERKWKREMGLVDLMLDYDPRNCE